jgi:hypothetical protein
MGLGLPNVCDQTRPGAALATTARSTAIGSLRFPSCLFSALEFSKPFESNGDSFAPWLPRATLTGAVKGAALGTVIGARTAIAKTEKSKADLQCSEDDSA